MPDDDTQNTEKIGLPDDMRVKRTYTMSESALKQRRNAAKQPKPGMDGKRNNWKHGQYAKSFLTRLKPCLSSCNKYPCSLIEDEKTEPGGDCLDAEELLNIIHAVHGALSDPENTGNFQQVAALNIANSIRIIEMMQEDILRDGTVVKSVKTDDKGGKKTEYKLHPSLLALPKMIINMGLTPDQFLITPKAKANVTNEKEGIKTLAQVLGQAGQQLSKARKSKEE